MKSTTVLAALTSLGFVAARSIPSVLPRALAERSPVGEPQISWNHEPRLPLPLKKDWTDLSRVAVGSVGCYKGKIACDPFPDLDASGRNGNRIFLGTDDERGSMQVSEDGSVRHEQHIWPSSLWADGAKTTWNPDIEPNLNLPGHEKAEWKRLVSMATYVARCKEAEILCAPRDGYPDELKSYGKHVLVKTDKLGDVQVHKDGSIKFQLPTTLQGIREYENRRLSVGHSGPESRTSSSRELGLDPILPRLRPLTPLESFLTRIHPLFQDYLHGRTQGGTGNHPAAGSSSVSGHESPSGSQGHSSAGGSSTSGHGSPSVSKGEHTNYHVHPSPKG